MSPPEDLASYYAARAAEYERVYAKPERQRDLAQLRRVAAEYFRGRRVLEVACGTGYWTEIISSGATSVVATDVGVEVLAIARAKSLPSGARVQFHQADAFALCEVPGDFDAAFAGFWLSHVRREDIPRFLAGLHESLGRGARVMLIDNRYVEGSSTPIARTDDEGNTYQRRTLTSGAEYEVVKNFLTAEELQTMLTAAGARSVQVVELPYYWYATYEGAISAPQGGG